jgi:two-component system, chemotaxis family, chemotaxis protein CheY
MSVRLIRAVITEGVETQLQETAALCRRMNLPLRCLHLTFSALTNRPEGWQDATINAIAKGVEDTDALIYVCADGDMFVLSRLATRKTLLRLLRDLPGELVPTPERMMGLAHLFELNIEGTRLEQIVQTKLREREAAQLFAIQEEVRVKDITPPVVVEAVGFNMALHGHLVASVATRRKDRKVPSILFVEDDVFSQKLLGNALCAEYEVHAAVTGQEAIVGYLRAAPDVVFLDINLPDMTGLEVLQEIFRVDPRAFIVMLSGNGHKDNVMRAIRGGARGFIGKPFTLDKLQQYLNMCPFIIEKRQNWELAHG